MKRRSSATPTHDSSPLLFKIVILDDDLIMHSEDQYRPWGLVPALVKERRIRAGVLKELDIRCVDRWVRRWAIRPLLADQRSNGCPRLKVPEGSHSDDDTLLFTVSRFMSPVIKVSGLSCR